MTPELFPLAQQTMPHHRRHVLAQCSLSRVIHIFGAIVLVGGLFYLRSVVTPSPAAANAVNVDQIFGGRRATWAKWVGIATLLLIVTGLWNYINIIKTYDVASSYHMIVGLKILAALALFLLAALLAGRTAAAETLRQKMRIWLGICLVLGILTVVLGSVLRSYPHNPKVDAAGPPTLVAPSNPSPTE